MLKEIFKEKDLPIKDLEKIGLATKGKLLIDVNDLQAILSGKRTDMISLKNLSADGLNIDQLDAKISMKPNAKGKLDLIIHPIYKEASYPPFLTDVEAQKLQNGESVNISKTTVDSAGNKKQILVEFDKDTKEFVITDTDKVIVPDMVNNEKLTLEQKERYRKGQEVELKDGTVFQMNNTDRKGMVSNKTALIVSLLLDGGISYLLMTGLKALFSKKHDEVQSKDFGKGYEQAFKDMQAQLSQDKKQHNSFEIGHSNSNENSRGYTRSGASR
ncbi:DUF4099 domain-containing protein [Pedobacter polaris]|uniref:DUF4099 domain-containing protein n=1 Tax=Pedobacter polaris TaxID=2571273 RepID=A0A4U1CR01_9SPHI|nr:DUF4099 domain-containing protein [Pedobacter polaris]TKC08031.1 DUF4099 domain-containing protein [Pedobacter polaris]